MLAGRDTAGRDIASRAIANLAIANLAIANLAIACRLRHPNVDTVGATGSHQLLI